MRTDRMGKIHVLKTCPLCILDEMEERMESANLILNQIAIGPMMNFVYLIGCPETHEAAVVDPAWDASKILKIAQPNLKIRHILLTHGHPDHSNATELLLQATDAQVYLHSDEVDYMKEVAQNFGMSLDFMTRRSSNIHTVSDGDTILVGKIRVQCLHTPGHTPGSLCFLVEGNLISGDTLFVDACGRVDMPGGDPEKMWSSLNRKLRALDDNIILLPGHDYGGSPKSTIGEQKRNNPYMQYESLARFIRDMG
jgi:hydroxyacylglutathione hydrolase